MKKTKLRKKVEYGKIEKPRSFCVSMFRKIRKNFDRGTHYAK